MTGAESGNVQVGTILADKYRIVSLLGRGGMGSVWRAEHLSLQAPIALKLIDPSIAQAPEALARFHREAKAAAGLRSPHVVQIIDHGVDPVTQTPFIAMELMEGESLAERLERRGPLPPEECVFVLTHVARALSKAHAAGVVHRDLKPDNIFIVKNDDEEICKVLDFGIAKSERHSVGAATATGMVMGTAYYMSPEQISGSRDVDLRTDLWALGVIAHECLTGIRPFESETLGAIVLQICTQPIPPASTRGAVPPGFDAWFQRAVARDPAQRFQSARDLVEALRAVCAGEPMVEAMSSAAAYHPTIQADSGSLSLGGEKATAQTTGPVTRTEGVTEGKGKTLRGPLLAVGGLMLVGLAVGAALILQEAESPSGEQAVAEPSLAAAELMGLAEAPTEHQAAYSALASVQAPPVATPISVSVANAPDAGAGPASSRRDKTAEPGNDPDHTAAPHQPTEPRRRRPSGKAPTKLEPAEEKPRSPFDSILRSRK